MSRISNAFSSKTIKVPRGSVGSAGYDNARENIDPTIKTKALTARDISTTNLYATGNISIGTTSPLTTVHIIGINSPQILVENSGLVGGAVFGMKELGGSHWLFKCIANGGGFKIRDQGNSTDRFFISPAGLIGVGTNSPATTLDVNGTIQQSNAYFHAYDTTGGRVITSVETDIPLDVEVRKDALYTHSTTTNNDEITFVEAGDYLVTANLMAGNSTSTRLAVDWRAKTNTGAGYTTILGTEATSYHRSAAQGKGMVSITFVHSFGVGDLLKFVGTSTSPTALTLVADGSRVTIQRI